MPGSEEGRHDGEIDVSGDERDGGNRAGSLHNLDLEAFLAEETRRVGHVRDGVGHRARRMADPNFLFLGFALSQSGRFERDNREALQR